MQLVPSQTQRVPLSERISTLDTRISSLHEQREVIVDRICAALRFPGANESLQVAGLREKLHDFDMTIAELEIDRDELLEAGWVD